MTSRNGTRGWKCMTMSTDGTVCRFLERESFIVITETSITVLTVPADMIVVGSGELVNQKEVLTKQEIARLDQARKSDKRVYIVSPKEVGNPAMRPKQSGTLTWHFKMNNSRDAVWACSRAFIWDAARINLPRDRRAKNLSQCLYIRLKVPPILHGDESTEYVKGSYRNFLEGLV